jgi:signal transduction histidine kinase
MDRDRDALRDVSAAVLAVASRRSVREVLTTIVTSARRLLGARYAGLGVPDDDGGFAEFVADGISDEEWAAIGPLQRQHGILGLMLCRPDPVRMADIRTHPQFGGWWPPAHPVLTDFIGMPVLHGDEILGELFLANKTEPGGFTADDEELLRLLAAHAAIALVNARLYERSRELSILSERHRIARELHDSMTQKLFSLRLTADAAATLLEVDPAGAAKQIGTVRDLAADATDELRAIMVGLRPADLAGDGLAPALRKQAELLDRVHPALVRFADRRAESNPGPVRLSTRREEVAYRIVQEALHNALRHADAQTILVELSHRDGRLVVKVSDDGRGFDPDAVAQTNARRRLGLASMRERAVDARGRLVVESWPGTGTTVRLELRPDG